MYERHQSITDANPTFPIWRYMDFAKFVSLLDRSALWFAHARTFEDPYDSLYNIEAQKRLLNQWGVPADAIKVAETFRDQFGISCWNISQYESAALWKMYMSGKEGVAITSTFGRLRDCFANYQHTVYAGQVVYIAPEAAVPMDNALRLFFHKRNSFEHEHEVRAIAKNGTGNIEQGFLVPVDLSSLITRVVVSPSSAEWFQGAVESVTHKYGLQVPVTKSNLYDQRTVV
jgi:hypothetical protein